MQYDYALYIGRFQPPHRAHCELMRQAARLAGELILVLGSADAAPSLRNPFTFHDRERMLLAWARANTIIVHCLPAGDSAYNLTEWLVRVKRLIDDFLVQSGKPQARLVLIGARKDDSSYYLEHFPDWPFHLMEVYGEYSATAVRQCLAACRPEVSGVSPPALGEVQLEPERSLAQLLEPPVLDFVQNWMDTAAGRAFFEEWAVVAAYRRSWEVAPYPPVFVAVDSLVLCNGRVLVIRRGRYPGKGLLALPGGFLDPGESLKRASQRELEEETGLVLTPQSAEPLDSAVFDDPNRDPRGRMITHVFLYKLRSQPVLPAVQGADDASEAFWFPLERLNDSGGLFFGDHQRIIRYFLNRLP